MKFFILLAIILNSYCVSSVRSAEKEQEDIDRSQYTASIYGFDVNGLTYEKDFDNPTVSAYDGNYRFNSLDLWTAIYTYCPTNSTSKFYFVLANAKLNTNTTQPSSTAVVASKKLKVSFAASVGYTIPEYQELHLRKYTPETYGGTGVSNTSSWEVGVNVNGDYASGSPSISSGYSATVGFSTNVFSDNVVLTPSSTNWAVDLAFNFMHSTDFAVNGVTPYVGDFIQRCVAVYEVSNYQSYSSNILFSVNVEGTTKKYSYFGFELLTKTSTQTYQTSCSMRD